MDVCLLYKEKFQFSHAKFDIKWEIDRMDK